MTIEQMVTMSAALLRDYPGLVTAFNNALPPTLQIERLPIVASPSASQSAGSATEGWMCLAEHARVVRSKCLGPTRLLLGCSVPIESEGQSESLTQSIRESYDLHKSLLSSLVDGEISQQQRGLLRKACTPEGYCSARGMIALPINQVGTHPAYLAGKCWADSGRPLEGLTALTPHPQYHNRFGLVISAMTCGDTDTLLVRAARYGREQTVRLLLEVQADVNQANGYGESPAFAACLASQVGTLRILLEAGADLSFEHDMSGFNLLEAAVRDFEEEMREDKVLFSGERGAAKRTLALETMQAKHTAQLAVLRCLLEETTIAPIAMAMCANAHEHHPIISLLQEQAFGMGRSAPRREQLRLLLVHGFTPNVQFCCTPSLCPWAMDAPPICSILHMACFSARHCDSQFDDGYVMVRLLVEGNGDPSILSSQQESPLSFAYRKNLLWMVKLLQASSSFALPHSTGLRFVKANPYAECCIVGKDADGNLMLRDAVERDEDVPSHRPTTQNLEELWSTQDWAAYKATCALSDEQFDKHCRRLKITPFMRWKDEVRANIGPLSCAAQGDVSGAQAEALGQAETQVQMEATAASPTAAADSSAAAASADAAEPGAPAHERRDTPMLTRAERAGVINRLHAMPDSPAYGSDAAMVNQHKLDKRAVQKVNQKLVARAEERLRRMR
tara:strand:- start:269 stop:2296 length:2028 start_codon:yes stop_codon:yes gene_type:complete